MIYVGNFFDGISVGFNLIDDIFFSIFVVSDGNFYVIWVKNIYNESLF